MEKKKVLLIATALMLLTATFPNISSTQLNTTNDLDITPLFQHKDTPMLCLQGCPLYGKHAWDLVHEVNSSEDVTSCKHCSWYCIRASIAMINHYYGGNISQDRISYYEYGELHRKYHNPPETDLGHGLGFCVDMATEALSWALNNATITHVKEMPTFNQIKKWIDSNRPIMRWQGFHVTVVDGYDTIGQLVHIINPWYGTETAIPYDETAIPYEWAPWVPPANATARSDEPEIWMDSDFDGIVDFDEINRFFTNPYSNDTDGDLVPDKAEIRSYTFLSNDSFDSEDVRKPDVDEDGLRAELDPDSDNGGCPDGYEDLNRNGRVDPGETDPFNPTDDPLLTHDIAITNITASNTVVNPEETMYFNVTAVNKGNFTETFNVSLSYECLIKSLIETQNVTLTPGQSITVNFTWIPPLSGQYTIIVEAIVTDDVNIDDNELTTEIYVKGNTSGCSSGGSRKYLM